MAWAKKRSPLLPTEPAFHHPDRCMSCGHLSMEHEEGVGCLVDGGTKYIEDESGNGRHVCSCEGYVISPEKELSNAT